MSRITGQPENMRLSAPAMIDAARCAGCTQCRLICPAQAIERAGYRCRVRADACTRCGRCMWICPVGCINAGDASNTSDAGIRVSSLSQREEKIHD